MKQKTILILWDASHIWGLMAFRGLRSLGLPCRLVKAIEIAQGSRLGKHPGSRENVLLVPGGNARHKASALGPDGMTALRRWVAQGGLYLGFCGGAGLALSDPGSSLGLCPLKRACFEKRFYHFLSGHVLARAGQDTTLSLPIWWPARFASAQSAAYTVLARYLAPGPDLWLADLPLARLPSRLLSSWARARKLDPDLGFPAGEPLLIKGAYGQGHYILSYAHLETPASPQANQLLVDLLDEYGRISSPKKSIPPWITTEMAVKPACGESPLQSLFARALGKMLDLCASVQEMGLLFQREKWLLGWRSGFSGMPCNNLLAALSFLAEKKCPAPDSGFPNTFANDFENFIKKASEWLWLWKLDSSLQDSPRQLPAGNPPDGQIEIFGHPMLGGGLLGNLLSMLDEYICSFQDDLE